jgi:hypothetical protein
MFLDFAPATKRTSMNNNSSTIVIAHDASRQHLLTIGGRQPCNMILVGEPSSGKSTTLDLWALRLCQAGAHVLLIGGARNQHTAILPMMRGQGIASDSFTLTGAREEITKPFTIAEVPRRGDIPATNTLQRAHRVGVLLAQVAEQRMKLEQSHEQPLVVMIDDQLSFEYCIGQLAASYALWPALNMHLWLAVQSPARLLNSTVPAVRSLWLAGSLHVYLRADLRRDGQSLGLSDQEAHAIANAEPGQITIRTSGASLRGWQQSDVGMLLPACPTEAAIITSRRRAYQLAA